MLRSDQPTLAEGQVRRSEPPAIVSTTTLATKAGSLRLEGKLMLLQFRAPLRAQVLVSERMPYKFQLFLSFEVSIAAHHGPLQLASFTSTQLDAPINRENFATCPNVEVA